MSKIKNLLPIASIIFIIWFPITVTIVYFSNLFSNNSGKIFFNTIELNIVGGTVSTNFSINILYVLLIGYLLNFIFIFLLYSIFSKTRKDTVEAN